MGRGIAVIGAGPAGCAAAISARMDGAAVTLFEKTRFPRHKVCGEFLSPGIRGMLARLGAWESFMREQPAVIKEAVLHIGARSKRFAVPECGYGLSRSRLDLLLLERSQEAGAVLVEGRPETDPAPADTVIATGRAASAPRGSRLFGFKAHFTGPRNDAVEMFFFRGAYVGVSAIERGLTNVCGLATEETLRRADFDFEAVIHMCEPLRERMRGFSRTTKWFATGPVVCGGAFRRGEAYAAGDALVSPDPFTGTGVLSALITGHLAGIAAARQAGPAESRRQCGAALAGPLRAGAVLRAGLLGGWGERLLPFAPVRWLFGFSRPRA